MDEILDFLKNYSKIENIDLGFERSLYLEKISKSLGNELIKVLIGQRRTGKSYILRQLIKTLTTSGINPENIIYINKEEVGFASIVTGDDLREVIENYRSKYTVSGKMYLFIDEIQQISEWEKVIVSYAQDPTKLYEVFISGSNSQLLSSDLSTYLSGRYMEFRIFPLSFAEYIEIKKLEPNRDSFLKYMSGSSLPQIANLEEELVGNYIDAVKNTILLKDIIQRFEVRNPIILERLFAFLANNIGNSFSLRSISDYFESNGNKISVSVLGDYLSYLKYSFLIYEVPRFDMVGKKILESEKKYYLNDLGFVNYIFSSFDVALGRKLENLIFLELLRRGYSVFVGKVNNLEIDFIAEKQGEKIYVQSAYLLESDVTIEREYGNLEKIKDHNKKIVVSLDLDKRASREGIVHMTAWEFMLGESHSNKVN